MENNAILALFEEKKFLRICAPMVRYSKLAFRTLVRRHGVDFAYTPMIVSGCFVRSQAARDVEFTTNANDRPLVVQFAASNAADFAAATEYVAPFADGVDLNCGCPQRWAMSEGYGSHLLKHPELVADMVAAARRRAPVPVAIKIRVFENIRLTVELAQRAQHMGAAWITVHGRTPQQRCQPVNYDAIRTVKDACTIPVVANGDITSLAVADSVRERTGVDGVMAARGILSSPTMFNATERSVGETVAEWVDIALGLGTPFPCFHHHLMYMLETTMSRSDRREFNSLSSTPAVLDYLSARGIL